MAGAPLDIRFTRGIDAQNDTRLVEQPFLLKADNVYFDAEKGPRKRAGYSLVTNQTATTGGISPSTITSNAVVAHKDELLSFDNANMWAYSDSMGGWVSRGIFIPTAASMRPASPTSDNQVFCDSISYGSQWEMLVYRSVNSGNINFSVRDKVSGGYLRYNEVATTSASIPAQARLVRTTSNILLVYVDGSSANWTLYARPISTNVMASNFIGAPVAVETNMITGTFGTGQFDVGFDGANTVVFLDAGGSGGFASYVLNASGTVRQKRSWSGTGFGFTTALNIAPVDSGGSFVSGNFYFTVAQKQSTSVTFYDSDQANVTQWLGNVYTGATLGPTTVLNLSGSAAVSQVAAAHHATAGLSTLVVSRAVTGSSSPYTDSGKYTARWWNGYNAIAGTPTGILPNSAVLASKPFFYNAQPYAFVSQQQPRLSGVSYTSPTATATTATTQQGSAILLNLATGAPVATLGYGVTAVPDQASLQVIGRYVFTGGVPPSVNVDSTGTLFELPVPKTVKLVASASSPTKFDAINYYFMYGVRFTTANQIQSAQFGDTRVFSGGITSFYDGASVVEHSFLSAPEITDVNFTGGIAGTFAAGTYYACAIYEWTDRQGNLHRSAPGPSTTLTLNTASTVLPSITTTAPITLKGSVNVAVYMTKAGGTLYYRVGSVAAGSPLVNYTVPVGAVSAETLYTTGNILPNDPWPNSSSMAASRNRIFLAGGEDAELLYYSKAFVKGEGQSLSLAFTKRIASVPGPITAVATMDDKIVVFKQRSILYFYGQNGPGTDGSNDDFSASQLLTTEVGCVSRGSLLTTADGVYFQSEKGIWLLSRSMNLTFVGQPIGPLTLGKTITSAVLTAKNTTVRFGTLDGSAFIYHYRMPAQFGDSLQCGQWTTYSNYKQYNATLYRGGYCFARSDGRVAVEQDASFKDDAQPVKFTLSTAWLRVGALLQTGQFTDVALLGSYAGPHTLLLRVHRDYSTGVDSVLKYATPTAISTSTWGSDPTWGGRTPFGGDFDDTYVARWRLPRGCTAMGLVRFSISDEGAAGYDLGATCQILGLNLLGQGQSDLAHPGDKKRQ